MRLALALFLAANFTARAAEIQITPVQIPAGGQPGFTLLAPEQTGVRFSNRLSEENARLNRIYELGSGVALGDVDGDGLCDIYLARIEGDNALYKNLGNWRFEEITAKAGVACANQFSTGAVLADVDGDGDLDLLVSAIGRGVRLFLNDGKGVFTEATDSGLAQKFGATSMTLADIDGDGDLDLYVCNYRTTTTRDNPNEVKVEARKVNGKIVVTPEDRFEPVVSKGGGVIVVEKGEPDILYLNDGHGHFTAVSWTDGHFLDEAGKALAHPPRDWGLSAAFHDLNNDSKPDLYVCNDFFQSPDRVWINQGGGIFRAIEPTALRNMSMSSMTVDFADINRDGFDDFFVADMLSPRNDNRQRQRANVLKGDLDLPIGDPFYRPEVLRNTLCLNRGDGTFAEIAQLAGLEATEWTWGSMFMDVDLDGFEDLLVTTGNLHDVLDADGMRQNRNAIFPKLLTPNATFRNNGDLTFSNKSAAWGFNFTGISQGMAAADLDNDGDLDVVVNCLNSPALIYKNNAAAPRVAVRLKGGGIGAKLKVIGARVPQTQTIAAGGRYLSSDDAMRVFAAGPTNTIEIRWPSGNFSRHENIPANSICLITEPSLRAQPPAPPTSPLALFTEIPSKEPHVDEPFDDFARQPLLPNRLSQLGPPVIWAAPEFLAGSGKGGTFAGSSVARDQIGAATVGPSLFALSAANYEDAQSVGSAVKLFNAATKTLSNLIPVDQNSAGALASADVNKDGALDLFVAGRIRPGRYPEPADSRLFLNKGGQFQLAKIFEKIGLVTGAIFVDVDRDGDADLVVSCEWGSPRLFLNDRGAFTEATAQWGLAGLTGWWTTIASADFDGDGKPDLIVGNFGRNTKYQRHLDHPLKIYFGDLDNDGRVELFEAWHDAASNHYVPVRDFDSISRALPALRERIATYREFGRASIEEILGDALPKLQLLTATTFETHLLLNRGDHFEKHALPVEAQFAPVMSIAIADFNGDKLPDIFLAQNFFDVETETSRYDAGTGLVLLNLGQANFRALSPAESGVRIYGEQRGSAAADFDGDGKIDLAVAQNRGPLKIFRNTSGK